MSIIFVGMKTAFYFIFISNPDLFYVFGARRNVLLFKISSPYYLLRDLIFIFGGIHILVFLNWKKIWNSLPTGKLAICYAFIPYIIVMFLLENFDEMRDYIAAIPIIIIPFMVYLTLFSNSFLKLKDSKAG